MTTGGIGLQNVFYGSAASCDNGSNCAGFNSVIYYNQATAGTNTYEDPLFTNTSDLLANWVGAASCSSYTDTAACMGWSFSSQTATTHTPISDLMPTASGTSGKGYQPPGPCASNPLYPTWLKGVVYLHWTGSAIVQQHGLVTTPCGL